MNKTKAFPVITGGGDDPNTNEKYFYVNAGMDLRDYFAAKAMQSFTASWINAYPCGTPLTILAENSYKVADEMMKARENNEVKQWITE